MKLAEAQTPAAVVDLPVFEANCRHMAERMTRLGVRLRGHVKTHKCVEAARIQVRGHFGGITVSTLAEARAFSAGGFRDITYAVPVAPARLREVAELARGLDRLSVLLDGAETLVALEETAAALGVRYSVFLKVDCGYHRAGVDPARPEAVRLARALAESTHVDFRGILTHAGHSYGAAGAEAIRAVAEEERAVMATFAETLRGEGVEVPEVSVGSTPTMALTEDLTGVTEARPGNYTFFDEFQVAVGSCRRSEVAFSVLTTVLACHPHRRRLIVDAGALAMSKDPGATHVDPDAGYGALLPAPGAADAAVPVPGLRLASLSQEHGIVDCATPAVAERFPVGSRLRVSPNHSCLTAALFDEYLVAEGDTVVDRWRPVRGW